MKKSIFFNRECMLLVYRLVHDKNEKRRLNQVSLATVECVYSNQNFKIQDLKVLQWKILCTNIIRKAIYLSNKLVSNINQYLIDHILNFNTNENF